MENYVEALTAAENTLRDLIQEILVEKLGQDWVDKCGVTPERIDRWKERREAEKRKIQSRGIEERLIYYADFYDLPVILEKHWQLFEPCLGKRKTMEVYLKKLEDFRNPEAHRRGLFPHEISLIIGITGDIRTAVTNFKSKRSPEDEFFPRLERVVDTFGNVATPKSAHVRTGRTLRPGDEVTFVATAWDPRREDCEFRLFTAEWRIIIGWTSQPCLKWVVCEEDIARHTGIYIAMRSKRKYHASVDWDDLFSFDYTVLPKTPQ